MKSHQGCFTCIEIDLFPNTDCTNQCIPGHCEDVIGCTACLEGYYVVDGGCQCESIPPCNISEQRYKIQLICFKECKEWSEISKRAGWMCKIKIHVKQSM